MTFNKALALYQSELIFREVWQTKLKKTKQNLVISVGTLVFGIFLILNIGFIGWFLILASFHFGYKFYTELRVFQTAKKKYLVELENEFEELNEFSCTWTLTENHFESKSEFKQENIVIPWSEFENFKVIKGQALLFIKNRPNNTMCLGREEIGHEKFEELLIFLQSKLNK